MFLYAGMGITKEILGLLSRVMHWPCWIWMDWISMFSYNQVLLMYSTSAFYASVFVRLIDKLFNILLTYYELMELIVDLL